MADKTEALSGYRPDNLEVEAFLRSLTTSSWVEPIPGKKAPLPKPRVAHPTLKPTPDKSVTYTLFGQTRVSANASRALVEILCDLAVRDASRLPALAAAVRTNRMAHVAPSPEQINPHNPAIARAHPIAPGWMVGLNISNRTEMTIIRAACEVWRIRMPEDIQITMPNG